VTSANASYRESQNKVLMMMTYLIGAEYVDLFDTPRGFPGTKPKVPSANEVAQGTFQVERKNKMGSDLTTLYMTFGQFLDHDITFMSHFDDDTTE